ncbi:hypothetical protein [Nitrospira japonica]|uniref:hypothetical protein n=1 Tax=Nitrospira japonica TaxID=1325564 RepID=UPI0012DDD3EE|nr:hypothetical protein [Nitrospira japonica]
MIKLNAKRLATLNFIKQRTLPIPLKWRSGWYASIVGEVNIAGYLRAQVTHEGD